MPEVVIAFDPGPHTGVAILILRAPRPDRDGDIMPVDYDISRLETLEEPTDAAALYRAIARRIDQPFNAAMISPRPTVICESFTTFSGMVASQQEGILTQRIIGFIEGTCACLGAQFILQTPASRKPYETLAGQIAAKRLETKTSLHEISALAHALRYAYTRGTRAG